jgi:hypothetical protein
MKAKRSRRLVIDACVAGAAGLTEHPTSSSCRQFLETVRDVCHRVVFTEEIRLEWRKHRSRFAWGWYRAMAARRKVIHVSPTPHVHVRALIQKLPVSEAQREEIRKDVHLIEAAIQTDHTIISSDERARAPFREIARRVPSIRQVVWVNPTREEEDAIVWLKKGAPADKSRRLIT